MHTIEHKRHWFHTSALSNEENGSTISNGNGNTTLNENGIKEELEGPPLKMCKTEAPKIGTSWYYPWKVGTYL